MGDEIVIGFQTTLAEIHVHMVTVIVSEAAAES